MIEKEIVVASYKTDLSFLSNKWCKNLKHTIYEKADKKNYKKEILNSNKKIIDFEKEDKKRNIVYQILIFKKRALGKKI